MSRSNRLSDKSADKHVALAITCVQLPFTPAPLLPHPLHKTFRRDLRPVIRVGNMGSDRNAGQQQPPHRFQASSSPADWSKFLTPEYRHYFENEIGDEVVRFDVLHHRYQNPEKHYAALAWLREKREARERENARTKGATRSKSGSPKGSCSSNQELRPSHGRLYQQYRPVTDMPLFGPKALGH